MKLEYKLTAVRQVPSGSGWQCLGVMSWGDWLWVRSKDDRVFSPAFQFLIGMFGVMVLVYFGLIIALMFKALGAE